MKKHYYAQECESTGIRVLLFDGEGCTSETEIVEVYYYCSLKRVQLLASLLNKQLWKQEAHQERYC